MLERVFAWASSDKGYRTVGPVIAGVAAILAVFCLGYSIPKPLIGPHSFRQTQNAISSYYSVKEHGSLINNIMPVLGPPWDLPTELPLFQYLAGTLHWATAIPLDACGRVISAVCWLASVGVSLALLSSLGFGRHHLWIPAVFLLSSPLYLFWGATYMMETMALLLSLVFLRAVIGCHQSVCGGSGKPYAFWLWFTAAMASGSLAALQKASTWVIAYGLAIMIVGWAARGVGLLRFARVHGWLAPLFIVPYAVARAWFSYGDGLKLRNPFARDMFVFSNPKFQAWNYGTFEQKISINTWEVIGRHMDEGLLVSIPPFNHHAMLVLGLACVLLAKRQLPLLVFFAIAFLSGPLLFTNLYYVHNYYLTATGVWLLLGVSAAVMGVADIGATRRSPRLTAILVTAVFGAAGFFSWSTNYAVVLRSFPSYKQLLEGWTLPVQRIVPSPRTVLVLGDEWNPVWLYYAQRKGICWPEKTLEGFPGSRMEESLAMLGPEERLGAVVCMNQLLATEEKEKINKILRDFRMSPDGIATAIGVIFPAEDLIPQQAE